jgi:hypothetical protein
MFIASFCQVLPAGLDEPIGLQVIVALTPGSRIREIISSRWKGRTDL